MQISSGGGYSHGMSTSTDKNTALTGDIIGVIIPQDPLLSMREQRRLK